MVRCSSRDIHESLEYTIYLTCRVIYHCLTKAFLNHFEGSNRGITKRDFRLDLRPQILRCDLLSTASTKEGDFSFEGFLPSF